MDSEEVLLHSGTWETGTMSTYFGEMFSMRVFLSVPESLPPDTRYLEPEGEDGIRKLACPLEPVGPPRFRKPIGQIYTDVQEPRTLTNILLLLLVAGKTDVTQSQCHLNGEVALPRASH